jgi:hypothetical protein
MRRVAMPDMNCDLLLFNLLRSAVADATRLTFHLIPALKGRAKIMGRYAA